MLAALTVRNFRNLASIDRVLPPEGVVVLGANGHGKTNLLEAMYYLVLFRSLRGARDAELVRFGEAGFFVAGDTAHPTPGAAHRLTAGYEVQGRRKKVTVDGHRPGRLADAVGRFTAVAFAPTDRVLVAGPPSERRRWLDVLLSLTVPRYLDTLAAYRQALKQRNAALRDGTPDAAWAFDAPLAVAGAALLAARLEWVAAHAARLAALIAELGETGTAAMTYRAHRHLTPETLREQLTARRSRDRERRATGVGPHRDELALMLEGRPLRTFGSAGQQRTAAIALRLLEAEALTRATGQAPVGLFDDVFVELDQDRQARLLALLGAALPGQAIVVAPRESEVPAALFARPRWRMEHGQLHG